MLITCLLNQVNALNSKSFKSSLLERVKKDAMATIEEETARRLAQAKKLNPWMAIDYLESLVEEQRARIAELERELTNWPIEHEDDVSKKLFSDSV